MWTSYAVAAAEKTMKERVRKIGILFESIYMIFWILFIFFQWIKIVFWTLILLHSSYDCVPKK